ncbi:MAG: NAD(P)-binding domain-containing protein, partial [[Mycobacterium] stephanolepidis]
MTNIAFIGLGHMGLPMAVNLTKAGHAVAAFDLSEQARAAATEAGVPLAESGAAAATNAEVVITMLPKGEHVLAAYQELLPAARPGTLFI